jgi:hypothetical protein
MDELFRFALSRPADRTDAAVISLEHASHLQSHPPAHEPPSLEQIAAERATKELTWPAFERSCLFYLLSDGTTAFLSSAEFTGFAAAAAAFQRQLAKDGRSNWVADTVAFADQQRAAPAALADRVVDTFLALMILRSGGPTHLQAIIRAARIAPGAADFLTRDPSLDELAGLIRLLHLIDATVAAPPTAANQIDAMLHATLLLPPKIFASFEKPVHAVGITDLLVVKQHVLRYELGEIARIENVLKGELRAHSQKHTLSNERETFLQTETTTETDRELTNTDHVSLRNEIATTLSEDTKVDAGLHAQYSGVVDVQADLTVAYDKASTESRRSATEIAKDVTQRAAQRVTEKTQQSETTRIIETFEENEEQKFDNKDANVSGIYQWVDKVYAAQVFNYGKRLMFDLMVPEPAASLLLADQAPLVAPPVAPEPFDIGPLDLTYTPGPNFYGTYVAKYKAIGVEPPPTDSIVVASAHSYPYEDDQFIAASEVVAIQDGYEAYSANVLIDYLTNDNAEHDIRNASGQQICFVDVTFGTVVVHAESVFNGNTPRRGSKAQAITFNPVREHSVPLSAITADINELSVNVEVLCRPTLTAIAKWQLDTYQAIAAAWQKLHDDYTAQVEAAKLDKKEVGVLGESPPDANRQTERIELKRSCIAILDAQPVAGYDEVDVAVATLASPDVNSPTFFESGAWVRWFEQAFEWDRISYVFYPYYWGRSAQWQERLQLRYDSDPLFESFLRAGYARVVVPVRTGFNDAVSFYLATGRPWMGGDLPSIGDRTYLPITEELKEQTGAPGDEKPVGDPWEIRLTTRLVKLRKDDALPPAWQWTSHDDPIPPGPWDWTGDTGG